MQRNQYIVSVLTTTLCMAAQVGFCQPQNISTEGKGKFMLTEFATNAQERVTVLASVAASLRESAIAAPTNAIAYYFSEMARGNWKIKIDSEMIAQQQSDFFLGAIMLAGSQNEKGGIVGLYNPWWDGILLMQFDGNGKGGENDAKHSSIQVSKYYLLSGETFRGEQPSKEIATKTVVPQTDPMSVELWRVCAGTRKAFLDKFPLAASPSWDACRAMLMGVNQRLEMERLQTRSALRMQHYLGHLKNKKSVWIGAYLQNLLREGSDLKLRQHFQEEHTQVLLNSFRELPKEFRKDFFRYGCLPTKDGTLYVYINKKMPRLYATVTMLKTPPTAKTTSLEWYDLIQCDELLNAWNNRKEVAK